MSLVDVVDRCGEFLADDAQGPEDDCLRGCVGVDGHAHQTREGSDREEPIVGSVLALPVVTGDPRAGQRCNDRAEEFPVDRTQRATGDDRRGSHDREGLVEDHLPVRGVLIDERPMKHPTTEKDPAPRMELGAGRAIDVAALTHESVQGGNRDRRARGR